MVLTTLNGYLLKGSVEELRSPHALKILATCIYAGIPLERLVYTPGTDDTAISFLTPPSLIGSTLRLEVSPSAGIAGDGMIRCSVSSTNAALRWLAASVPSARLLGESPAEDAVIDSWMSYGWSSIDLPIEILLRSNGTDSSSREDLNTVLELLDQHLLYRTYISGSKSISIADIRFAVSLHVASELWNSEGDKLMNVKRWYQTLIHQEWFERSLKILPDLLSSTTDTQSTTALGGSCSSAIEQAGGVLLNGVPTPVVNKMYKRSRIRIKELLGMDGGASFIGQSITVAGWSRTIRKASSKLIFVELNDGSTGTSLQCVLDIVRTSGFDDCKASGGTGSSFSFVGTVTKSVGGEQVIDLLVTSAVLLGAVYGGSTDGSTVGGMLYPLSKKEHTLEHLRDVAHLRPRGNIHAAAMRIRSAMAYATHNFFHNHGFLYIHTPILTGADCEGAGEQFCVTTLLGSDHLKPDIELPKYKPPPAPVVIIGEDGAPVTVEEKKMSKSEMKRQAKKQSKGQNKPSESSEEHQPEIVIGAVNYEEDFFGQRMNLTVSGQLNVETHACALSDVYTFGPTFRAEESRTYRHLSEFWMIEPEIAFATLHEDINLAEDYLKYCVQYALDHCSADLEFFENNPNGEVGLRDRLKNVLHNEFKRLTYTEAIELLQKAVTEDGVQFEVKPEWGIDLPSEHERYICEKVFKMPVVLTNYPKEIKAFYMKVNDDQKTVAAADILVPKIGEIIGGSQREHRFDVLKQRCIEMGLDPKAVWWYLDLRRYGTVPHAGFGLGFERLILFITGLDNIRDVIPFPRWVGNAKF